MIIKYALPMIFASLLALSFTVSAGGGFASKAMIEKSGLANESYSEPCMNGGVSANGLFHSQLEEDKTMSRMIIHSQADS